MNGIEQTRPDTPASTTTARPRRADRTTKANSTAKASRAKAAAHKATSRKARLAAKEMADKFAVETLPIILEIWVSGVRSRYQLAKRLNEKNVPTARGKQWTSTALRNLMNRIGVIMTNEHAAATAKRSRATDSNETSRTIGPLETEKV